MHEKFLFAAMEEAKQGLGLCAPNPCVGAVAVKSGHIIAQAFHNGAGNPHAEQLLIEKLPPNEPGVTLYVTLEPCNHYGRTPPCVDAIVKYGFERVVFAYCDPNPLVARQNTSEKLRAHGISVLHHPLPEMDAFYQSYRYWTETGRPWVTVKMAQTFDGKIAAKGGERVILSNSACEAFTHKNRLASDIILTTAQTVNQDDPRFNVRLPDSNHKKPVAIIDSRLTVNPASVVFSMASHCSIFYDEKCAKPKNTKNRTYHPIPAEKGLLDLGAVVCVLGDLGYHDVWLEAGGRMFTAMHQARLVQRTYIYLVPTLLGEDAISTYHHPDVLSHAKQVSWQAMDDNMIARLDWQ